MTHRKPENTEPADRMSAEVSLGGGPEPGPVAEAFARTLGLLVPTLGDYAFLHVQSGAGLVAAGIRHRDPGLEPALARLLQDVRGRMTAEGSPIARAFASGEAQLSDVGPGPSATPSSADVASVLGPRSFVAVPVGPEGDLVGVLTVARFETEEPFGPGDLALTRVIAGQLATALDLARRLERAQARATEAEGAAERERAAADEARQRTMRHLAQVERDRDEALAELERHREQTRTTGQRFEARLLDAVGEAVIATDLDGRIIYWNRSAERLYGWSRGEALGRDLGDTAPAVTSRSQASAAMARMMAGESWSGELAVRRKDGTTFPASLTGTPIFGDDGKPVGLISISTDLTGQKTLEERLLQSQRAQAVGRVAGGVAHEFNNCLTSISGYAELIRRELEQDDPLIEDLEAIEASSRRAAALIHQLLAYSRRQVLRPRVVSLNGVVRGMSSVIRSLLGEKIQVSLDLTADPDTARVDQGQLEQVVTNLVLNAQEAIRDAGRVGIRTETIELTQADADRYSYPVTTGPYVSLIVEDDGVGMDAETLKHAFEPFYTTKEDGLGAGLGLSTTYGVMKQSGGYVWVDSSPSRGTTVRLVLPLAPVEEPEAPTPTAASSSQAGCVILLVEDDSAVRDLALRILSQDGHEVLEAEDGTAALLLWDQHGDRVDLVVTDVVMPKMSGRALVDRLRVFRPELPALFMSGYTDDAVALHGITEGRDPFLGKPFSSEALSAKVRDLLSEGVAG